MTYERKYIVNYKPLYMNAMMRKLLFLFFIIVLGSSKILAQTEVKGIVIDQETKEPLIGVTIMSENSKVGTVTDLDGSFTMKLPKSVQFSKSDVPEGKAKLNEKLIISYVGYKALKLDAMLNMGTIEMETDAIGLKDVVVTSSVAIRRKTPVAISVVEPEMLETKLSVQEFPEILKTSPGVYATKQGGGYGDSRVNIRGFESQNVAVMVNGVPMNDMEWGGVYWSNWAGLSDVTRSMQLQRGLGASKVAAPSIGGSINIVTRSTDAKKGGFVSYALGNDGYNKITASVSTGLTKDGWAMTFLGGKNWGDGYIMGTEFEAYTWFVNVSKMINDNHQLSFTAFGSPQWHNQRYSGDKMLITEWQKVKDRYKFNPTYGFDGDGQRVNANRNRYHKPQLSLNHYWDLNRKSSLSTVLYMSIGDGAGQSWRGNSYTDLYGTSNTTGLMNTTYRTLDGYMDYGKLKEENAANENGSQAVITESRNNHTWVGLLSTYTTKLTSNIDFYGGIDLRYYAGLHDARIVDLMGGKYYIDPARKNIQSANMPGITDSYKNQKLKEGDIVYRDNTGYVLQEGLFTQAEYNKDALSLFVAGSLSNSTYWKVDRFYYGGENQKSSKDNFLGYTIKGGANYNLTNEHNVFANIGYMSRAPYMSGGYFTSIHTSNVVNMDAINEKSFSTEIGYGYRSRYFTANVNAYFTKWMDKTMIIRLGSNVDDAVINLGGVDARHQGIEFDVVVKPINNLDITGMLSIGDWQWDSNAGGYAYNRDGLPMDKFGNTQINGKPIEPQSPDHAYLEANMKGIKVGNSAQLTAALGFKYKFFENFTFGGDFTYYGNNYANMTFASTVGTSKYATPWKIPAAGILDLNANYKFKMAGLDAMLMGNVNNVLSQEYISDAQDLAPTKEEKDWRRDVAVMYGFGRTYSVALKVRF